MDARHVWRTIMRPIGRLVIVLGLMAVPLFAQAPGTSTPATPIATSQKQPPAKQTPETGTVYVTKTGKKYHRAGCRSLAKSAIPMKLQGAAKTYAPCEVCKPPTL